VSTRWETSGPLTERVAVPRALRNMPPAAMGMPAQHFPAGVTRDALGNVWVANQAQAGTSPSCPGSMGSITVYANGASGNVSPIATISGPATQLSNPYGIAINPDGNIYVVNACNASITVYASGSNGNVAPIAVISGSNTGLDAPGGTAGIFPSAMP
jgi:hypothetical protein